VNIDVINTQVAKQLGLKEAQVKLINQYYWRRVYDHLYTYNENPVNIENVCVLYPQKYFIKNNIEKFIKKLRKLKRSKKFKKDSPKYLDFKKSSENHLRGFLRIRKALKFTN